MSISLDCLPQNQRDFTGNVLILNESQQSTLYMTATNFLSDYTFQNHSLTFYYTDSLQSAKYALKDHHLAVILWFLPSRPFEETQLNFLNFIRNELNNLEIRILLLSETISSLPDDSIFLTYDIQDYLLNQEITRLKLVNQLTAALTTYNSLVTKTIYDQYFQNFEQELSQSEARLASILELAEEVIISIDESQKITVFNQDATAMFGYKDSEARGQAIDILLPEKLKKIYQKYLQTFLNLPDIIISKRKVAEDERSYLAHLIEVSLNEIYIFDAQTLKFDYANRGALANIGYSLEQLKMMTPLDIKPKLTPKEFESLIAPLRSYQQEKLVFNTVHRRSDGSYYPVEVHLQLVKRLEKSVFLAIILDVTEQKATHKALQQAHDELEQRVQNRTFQFKKINAKLRKEIQHRSRIEEALKNLSLGVQAQTSQVFFESLVQHLFKALNVEYVMINELILSDKNCAKTIAFCHNGEILPSMKYGIKDTPCELVVQGQNCCYSGNVQESFPQDIWLQENNLHSYLGMPLKNSNNEVVGVICILSGVPFTDLAFMKEILHIFAVRAGTELERRQVEQKLRESEENFCQLTDNLNQVFYLRTFSKPFKIIYISPAFETIWGLPLQQLYENPLLWLDSTHPEDRDRVQCRFDTKVTQGNCAIEYRIIRPDGEIRWILERCFPVSNAHGDVYRIAGLAEDITERKQIEIARQQLNQNLETLVAQRTTQLQQEIELHRQTEQALRESEERWQLAIRGTNDGIWDWNLQTNEIFHSLRWKEMLGYQDWEINNTSDEWSSRLHPDDLERVIEAIQAHLDGKTPYYQSEHRMRCKDGHYKWILDRGKAIWDETGKPIRMVGSHSDISERKSVEEALRQSEEKLRKITALVPGMVYQFGVSPDNRYFLSFASDGATELYELTPEAVVEDVERIFARVKPEHLPSFREAIETSRQQLSEFSFDFEYLCPSGQQKWIRVHSLPQALEEGIVIWNGIAWDISLDKKREDELRRAKLQAEAANQAKSEFLANMSHEIRTPLNAILGFCQLLQQCIDDPRPRDYLNIIATSGKTLLALINDILDLSKIEAGKLELCYELVDLRRLVTEIQTLFSHKACQKNLFLLVEVDPQLPEKIIFDEVRLRQILFNVVGNAIKFTEQGHVKIILRTEKPLYNHDLSPTINLIIEIEDTGIGIQPEQQSRIFESFTQQEGQSNRKYGGSGLGLAITKRLTQMLGGTIQLVSHPYQGSTFTFCFPKVRVTQWTEPLSALEIDSNLNQFARATILAVDDIQSNLDLLKGYFYPTHHNLMMAQSGEEAIALTHRHRIDLILLDLLMPEMDGYAVIKSLKNNPKTQSIPIIIVTASSLQAEEANIRPFCQGFLRKPVTCQELIVAMQSILPLKNDANASPSVVNFSLLETKEEKQWQEKIPVMLMLWKNLATKRILRELRQFHQQIEAIAQEYHYPPLLDYTTILRAQLEAFDLEHLDQSIEHFPRLLQQLKDIK